MAGDMTSVVVYGSSGSRHWNPHRNGHIVPATATLAGLAAHFVGPWVGCLGFLFLLIPLFWIALFAQGDIDEKDYRARLELLRANAWPRPHVK